MKKFAFTLAEIIITLSVIGVVIIYTVPNLYFSTTTNEYRTRIKQGVSILSNAVLNYSVSDHLDFSNLVSGENSNSIFNLFNTQLAITSDVYDNKLGENFSASNYTLFLNNGIVISWPKSSGNCTLGKKCTMIIDVNGIKFPNSLSTATAKNSSHLSDQFVLDFYNNVVTPHDERAKYAMYEKEK